MLKPTVGSWGRLLAKVNDREAPRRCWSTRRCSARYHHSIFYIQEYRPKPGRDIRAFVIGDRAVCAIYRTRKHWITNTARGGRGEQLPGHT